MLSLNEGAFTQQRFQLKNRKLFIYTTQLFWGPENANLEKGFETNTVIISK